MRCDFTWSESGPYVTDSGRGRRDGREGDQLGAVVEAHTNWHHSRPLPERGASEGPIVHNICITTQRHSGVLRGTQRNSIPAGQRSDQRFHVPLQGEGRGFEPLSAHDPKPHSPRALHGGQRGPSHGPAVRDAESPCPEPSRKRRTWAPVRIAVVQRRSRDLSRVLHAHHENVRRPIGGWPTTEHDHRPVG
jgi:hypothetical protein